MKYIKTGQTRSDAKRKVNVMVDDKDFEVLSKYNWTSTKDNIITTRGINGKHIQMSRFILQAPNYLEVDHIDGNRLNNKRSNLRLCNSSQNKMNRGARKDNKSGYKGVSWHKQQSKWTARIKVDKKYLNLGLFVNIKDAAIAYNKAAKIYHKEFAYLNKM